MKPAARHASDRLLDLSVAALAWWTICCNVTVLTKGTGRQLLITAGISGAVLLALAIAWWRRRRANPPSNGGPSAPPDAPSSAGGEPRAVTARLKLELRKPRWWALLASLAVIAWWPAKISNWAMWSVPAALVVLFTALSALEPWPPKAEPSDSAAPAWHRGALWALSIAAALITACLHLPNTDDVLYVNIAVALADDPSRTLFAVDTLHGATVIPHAAYHVCSFELLAGALSLITRIPPLEILHLGLSVFAALLTPLAWWRLFRLLDPQRALWMVAAVMLWYVLDGTTPFSLSMHAFARLFQGKAVLLSAGVAVITAYGIEFGLRPSLARLLWLSAAQIAGLGLSSTGVWLCPLVAVTAVIAAQPIHWRAWKPVALACASSGYVLAIGIWLALQVHGVLDSPPDADPVDQKAVATAAASAASPGAAPAPELFDVKPGFERIRKAFALTFFTLERGFAYGAFLLLAWPLARSALARRYIASFMVIGVFLLCSPWLARVVADRVTGYSTYPRVTWFLPFGAAIAICFVAPIMTEGRRWLRLGTFALSAALIATFFSVTPKRTVFQAARLSWPPRLKVERPAYEVSLRLKKELPAGSAVVAPQAVSLQLPMLLDAPLPIMTKPRYFTSSDRHQRLALRDRTEKEGSPLTKEGRRKLIASLDQFKVRGVVLSKGAAQNKGMSAALADAGFHRVEPAEKLEIWIRERNPLEKP